MYRKHAMVDKVEGFDLIIRGKDVDDGTIDYEDLVTLLGGVKQMIQATWEVANPERGRDHPIRLSIKETRRGCFHIDLSVTSTWLENLLKTSPNVAIVEVLAFLGIAVVAVAGFNTFAAGGKNILEILRTLRGRKIVEVHKTTSQDGKGIEVELKLADGASLMTKGRKDEVEALFNSKDFHRGLRAVKEVLEKPGYDSIGSSKGNEGKWLSKEDFSEYKIVDYYTEQEQLDKKTDSRRASLVVLAAHLDGKSRKWRLRDEAQDEYTARIEDSDFIEKVAKGKHRFSANTTIDATLEWQQVISSENVGRMNHVITKVHGVNSPPHQLGLDLDQG